jgi:hypothetical protein
MVSHIPVWVFAVFGALVVLGIRQSRTRLVAPDTLVVVALAMFGLSLYGVIAAFGVNLAPLLAWALGISASASFGRRLLGPRGLERMSSSVVIPGSWLPMGLLMAIFAAKFVLGFASAVRHPVVTEPWFIVAASFTFGILSGAFVARALVVRAFVRRADSDA